MVEIPVYVGAIMVLILFGIMLTLQQVHLPILGARLEALLRHW
jgi:NADH:ubiquinone oxidoreductase subunit 6 (subunit J)